MKEGILQRIEELAANLQDYSAKHLIEIENFTSKIRDEFRKVSQDLVEGTAESLLLDIILQMEDRVNLRTLIDKALKVERELERSALEEAAFHLWRQFLVDFYVQ